MDNNGSKKRPRVTEDGKRDRREREKSREKDKNTQPHSLVAAKHVQSTAPSLTAGQQYYRPAAVTSVKRKRAIEKVNLLTRQYFPPINFGLPAAFMSTTITHFTPSSRSTSTKYTTNKGELTSASNNPSAHASRSHSPSPLSANNSISVVDGNQLNQLISRSLHNTFTSAPAAQPQQPQISESQSIIQRLQDVDRDENKVETLKHWNSRLNVQPKDCKKLLDAGAKNIFFKWLDGINTNERPQKDTSFIIELCLRLIGEACWTDDEVVKLRIDKVLRRLYKKFNGFKEVMSDAVIQLIRDSWVKYRSIYREKTGAVDDE